MLPHFVKQNCENFFSQMCIERMRSNESLHPRRRQSSVVIESRRRFEKLSFPGRRREGGSYVTSRVSRDREEYRERLRSSF